MNSRKLALLGVILLLLGGFFIFDIGQYLNLASLKAESSTDKATGIRTRKFVAANLNFAPGVADTVVGLLGLPSGALPDQALFAVADISLKKRVS